LIFFVSLFKKGQTLEEEADEARNELLGVGEVVIF
jgi:hypothetical protein